MVKVGAGRSLQVKMWMPTWEPKVRAAEKDQVRAMDERAIPAARMASS